MPDKDPDERSAAGAIAEILAANATGLSVGGLLGMARLRISPDFTEAQLDHALAELGPAVTIMGGWVSAVPRAEGIHSAQAAGETRSHTLPPSEPSLPPRGAAVEPNRPRVDSPAASPASVVRLWTPRGVAWAAVLLGFPGALILAALNWRRMGRTRKAIVHVIVAVLGTWVLFLIPGDGRGPGFLAEAVVAFYLNRALKRDQATFVAKGYAVAERNGLVGVVIGLVATVVIFFSGVAIAAVADGIGKPPPGVVAFGTSAGSDACHVGGQKALFSSTDPIYVVAVMRNTVQSGSHVVAVFDINGQTAGSNPLSGQGPFDCISGGPIGPLKPGAYVLHYRDESRPGSPDLASGTFTVAENPGSSSTASPVSTPSATPELPTSAPTPVAVASGPLHDDPVLEAMLPATVKGETLVSESYRGLNLFSGVFQFTDADIAGVRGDLQKQGLTLDDVTLADDGRTYLSDPPYFVDALRFKGIPADQLQSRLGINPGDLLVNTSAGVFTKVTVGGKAVLRGTLAMLDQTDHLRGLPYIYMTGEVEFVIVTDDPAWAADALRQLP